MGSLLPTRDGSIGSGPLGIVGADLWLHAAAYALLAVCLAWALAGDDSLTRTYPAVVLGIVAAYGLGIELVQVPIATRSFQVIDLAANVFGGVLGLVARHVMQERRVARSTR